MHSKHTRVRLPSRREILKYGLYGTLGAGLSSSLGLGGCGKKAGANKPSIILISVDTLRADHLSCYGYPQKTSSAIDQFGREALFFKNCFSQAPVTGSSFASILSGFLPHETKVFENLPLPEELETLPKILHKEGYVTAAVVSNIVLQSKNGWGSGFTIFDDTLQEEEMVREMPERIAEHTASKALELLELLHKEPFFMWIHFQDPHGPYTPPEGYSYLFRDPLQKPRILKVNGNVSGRGGIPNYQRISSNQDYYDYVARYDGEIKYTDQHFKRVIEGLKALGLYDEAVIIFTADHGEGMGENDYYFAHGENLHQSLLQVPLMIRYGGRLRGRRTDFVQHLDLVPTILKFTGVETELEYRGSDLMGAPPAEREIFAEMSAPATKDGIQFSLIRNGHKLVYLPLSDKLQLFDLKKDPQETRDLAAADSYRQVRMELLARLNQTRREDKLGLQIVNQTPGLSPEEKAKLRSIGYLR